MLRWLGFHSIAPREQLLVGGDLNSFLARDSFPV
jgi:hypothetical protein